MKLWGLQAKGWYSCFPGSLETIVSRKLFKTEIEAAIFQKSWEEKLSKVKDPFLGTFHVQTVQVIDFDFEN